MIYMTLILWFTFYFHQRNNRFSMVQDIHHNIKPEEVELVRRDYTANDGWETFLSYEDTRQVLYQISILYLTCQTKHLLQTSKISNSFEILLPN